MDSLWQLAVARCEVAVALGADRKVLKGAISLLPAAERAACNRISVDFELCVGLVGHHQPIRIGQGQRLEQNGMDHGEERRRSSDTERHHQDRDEREAGRARQRADSVAEITNQ